MAKASFSGGAACITDQPCDVVDKRVIGLDPVFRSCVKMKVKDLKQLQLVNIHDLCKPDGRIEVYSFMGHVINKVEVMGIVVMSDRKDRRHSFAVDDATGVILCVQWKSRGDKVVQRGTLQLPTSLQAKVAELEACQDLTRQEHLCLGDLVQVQGWVTTFRGQPEICVLDLRKFENPSLEIEAVLMYPSVYQVYRQPFILTSTSRGQLAGLSSAANTELAVTEAIHRHIQDSGSSHLTVTPSDIMTWPSVVALLPPEQGDGDEVILRALQSLESGRGSICRLAGSVNTYEVITAGCPMAARVMTLLKIACQNGKNAEMGCHVLQLTTELSRVAQYSRVDSSVVSHLLACLEASSDVICVAAQRYIAVS